MNLLIPDDLRELFKWQRSGRRGASQKASMLRQVLGADGWDPDRGVILLDPVKHLNLPVELYYSVPTVTEESQSAAASSSTAGDAAPRNTFEVRSFRFPEPAPTAVAQEPPKEWAGLINKTAQFVAAQPTEESRQECIDRTLRVQDPAKYRFLKAEDDLNVFLGAALKLANSLRGRGRRSHSHCGLRSTCRTRSGITCRPKLVQPG